MTAPGAVVLRELRTLVAVAIVMFAIPLLASRPYIMDNDVAEHLAHAPATGQKLHLENVRLIDGNPATLELERFEIWAPGAKIIFHDAKGAHELAPPRRVFYQGRIPGVEDSRVFFSIDPQNSRDVDGLILIAERKYRIGRGVRMSGPSAGPRNRDDDAPMLVTEVDPYNDPHSAAPWQCLTDGSAVTGNHVSLPKEALALHKKSTAGNVSNATYSLRLAIETDHQLYEDLGSTPEQVTAYITDLVGAASMIYQRDLQTSLTIGNLGIYAAAQDPYTNTPADFVEGLADLSTKWHANHCTPEETCTHEDPQRSAVIMVSGKLLGGGAGFPFFSNTTYLSTPSASADHYCGDDGRTYPCQDTRFAHSYAGAYAFVGALTPVTSNVPNPNDTVVENGKSVQYGLPSSDNFWTLSIFAHELGHVVGARHTQCVLLENAAEQMGSGRIWVDECAAGGNGCFFSTINTIGACFTSGFGTGTPVYHYCPAPPELGTIMSYCQYVLCPGGTDCNGVNEGTFRQSRYLFGKSGEPSNKMLTLFHEYLETATPDGTITVGNSPLACSTQTASVPSCDCKYTWVVDGGSIIGSSTSPSITFTPAAGSVTLTAIVTTMDGNGIRTQATRSTSCAPSCLLRHRAVDFSPHVQPVAAGSGFDLSLSPAITETGLTVAWFAQDSLPARQIGTGPQIHVTPFEPTQYWAVLTLVCNTNTFTDTTDPITITPTGTAPHTDLSRVLSVAGIPTTYAVLPSASAESVLSVPIGEFGLTYEWRQGDQYDDSGEPLGTGPVFHVIGTGPYWVRTIGSNGGATDSAVTWLVYQPPAAVDLFPGPGTLIGTNVDVALIGLYPNPPFGTTYEWRQATELANGALVKDPSTPVLNSDPANWVLHETGITGHAAYWVRVLTSGVTHDSDPVLLVVGCDRAPFTTILLNPNDPHVQSAKSITLFAAGFGRNLTYLWYRGISGDTSNLIGTGGSSVNVFSPNGSYWVRVTDDCAHSAEASIILHSCKPTIPDNGNPHDAYLPPQSTVMLAVTATPAQAGQTLHYQWYAGNIVWPIDGATSPTLAVDHAGTYFATVSGDCDDNVQSGVQSSSATVLACTPPVLGLTASHDMRLGVSQTLHVGTTGDALTYQWYQGISPDTSNPIADAITDTINVAPNTNSDYWVRVADHGVCVTDSATIHLTVCAPPAIVTEPAGRSVFSGSTATLTIAATAATPAPLHYAWFELAADGSFDQASGNDAASFTTPALTVSRTWFVRVYSGDQLSVYTDSQPATIHVCDVPEVHWSRLPHPLHVGDTFTLGITSAPEGFELYWYRGTSGDVAGSTLLAGPVSSSLSYQLAPATVTSTYWVRMKVGDCYADSSTLTLPVCVPAITQQPAGTPINAGSSTTLSVTATPSDVTYQWYVGASGDDTHPIANATASSYTASPAASTSYWVRVTGSCSATADSNAAQVTLCFPPAIVSNAPATQWSILGSNSPTSLWVSATGNDLTYQWYVGSSGNTSTAVPGATSSSLSVTPQNTTTYWVRVSGSCGAAKDSVSMLVNVCGSPAITAQPQGSVIFSGGTATMSVTASESTSTPMTYQWYRGASGDASAPVGTNAASFTTPALTAQTSYWVRVSCGVCNPTDSQAAIVSICNYPQVLAAPADQFIAIGQTATLSTVAGGTAYQWYVGASGNTSQPAPGQSNLSSYAATPSVTTQYWAQIQSGGCISRTQSAAVTVCVPTITQQPASIMINSGASTTVTVAANTTGLTYQWYVGNSGTTTSPISGATGSSVTVTPAGTTNYWARVTGSCGRTADSATATVTICAPPAISYATPTLSIVRGNNASMLVNATGNNLTYQWYTGTSGNTSAPISGATNSALTVAPQNTTSYWVRVSGSCGTANSITILVNVCATPSITAQPQGSIIFSGGTATMSITASEATTATMSYQWYRGASGDTSAPVGANSTSFTTPALTAQASYWVRVSCGVCNPIDSQAATISICNYPQVLSSPGDFFNTSGQTVRLFTSNGTGNTYQWYVGASGDTSHPYSSPNYYYADVAPTVTTQYWAQVQNGGCISRTATANVYVCVPTFTQQPASVTIVPGSSTTLTAAANTAGVTYQWYVGASGNTAAPIAGATGSSVTVTPSSNASYWVRAIGTCSRTTDSATATVTLCSPPVITGQPSGSSLYGGGTASLWVYATGSNLSYQWYYGNSGDTTYPVSGATTSTASIWIGMTTKVWVRITGQCGAVDSNATYASVYPTIQQQPPADLTVGYNATATISFTPGNNSYMSYVWKNAANGAVIATTSTPTLITPPITSDMSIYCEVWSGSATTTTYATALHVCYNGPNVTIAKAPNGSCSIAYVSSGYADDYQWYQGARGDTSHQAGSGSALYVCPTTATQYWLRAIVRAPDGTVSCYSDTNALTLP